MATSGSFDWSLNRDELITDAFTDAQVHDPGEGIASSDLQFAVRTLNRMLKAWQADGLQLWAHKEATLFLADDTIKYQLGSDHSTLDTYASTTLGAAAAASATSLTVASIAGISDADNIGIVLDDGTLHWDTVNGSPSGTTVTITTGLASAAASGNVVYAYTTKMPRPLKITEAVWREYDNQNDTPMDIISRGEYWGLGEKTAEGSPTLLYFDPQLDYSEVRIYNEPDDVKDVIKFVAHIPFDDMDAATNDFSFPQYWLDAIHYNLAYRLAVSYTSPEEIIKRLDVEARRSKQHAKDFDIDMGPLYLQPDEQML